MKEHGCRRDPWWLYVLVASYIHWWIPSEIGPSVNSFVLDFTPSYRSTLGMKSRGGAQKNPWTENDASLIHRRYDQKHVPENTENYIIIGSGIGGLWLAACLAKFGGSAAVRRFGRARA
jgi:hypothetical protein